MADVIQALTDFANWLLYWPRYFLGYLLGFIKSIYESLFSKLRFLWEHILSPLWDMLETLLSYFSLSSLFESFNALNGTFGYYMDLMQLPMLFSSVISGYFVRFLIRRIPIIG